jgi:putative oxidoreductase
MARTFETYPGIAYTLMRVVFGFLFFCHGLQKLVGAFGGHQVVLSSLLGAAAIIETTGGVLIMLGLLTSAVAFICCGEMAFAFFSVHFPKGGMPIQNGGELAILYCFAFLFIAAMGPGQFAIDAMLPAGRRRMRA